MHKDFNKTVTKCPFVLFPNFNTTCVSEYRQLMSQTKCSPSAARQVRIIGCIYFKPNLYLIVGNTNSKVFLHSFMNMQEKQISASVIKIRKKKLGVTTHFSKIITVINNIS